MLSFLSFNLWHVHQIWIRGTGKWNSGLAQVQLCLVDLTFTKICIHIHQDLCTWTKFFFLSYVHELTINIYTKNYYILVYFFLSHVHKLKLLFFFYACASITIVNITKLMFLHMQYNECKRARWDWNLDLP